MSGDVRPPLPMRLSAAAYRFRGEPFLLPALIVLGGIVLAEAAGAVDRAVGGQARIPVTLTMSSSTAIWLLSTVAGATITTAGVVLPDGGEPAAGQQPVLAASDAVVHQGPA